MHEYLRLLRYVKCQRGFLLAASLLTVAASILTALQPWPLKLLVDHVLGHAAPPLFLRSLLAEPSRAVPTIVIAGLALFLLASAVDAALAWSWTVAGRRMVYDLAQTLFAQLQRRSLLFHKRATVGDLMSRVSVDSWSAYQVVDTLVFAPAHALLTMGLMIFLMARLDPGLTWLAIVVGPLMVASSLFLGKPLRAAAKLRREIEVNLQAHIQQTLTGIPVVQAFGQEERESRRFRLFAESAVRSQQRAAILSSFNSLSSGLVTVLGSGAVLWLGARHVLAGSLEIGGILVFLFYLNSLQAQVKVFAGLYSALQNLHPAVSRVLQVLTSPAEIADTADARPFATAQAEIVFERVSTGYHSGRPVLQDISLRIPAKKTLAVVGATGAGKTTLASLIPRFLDPWEGRICVDGQNTRELRLKDLRQQIALVLQEPYLFPISIAENIAYGRPDAPPAEIEAAARAARAHEFISRLPQGYATVLGERGATLSGGERQRLSIARAFLKNAPILILDEPTSSLDPETERLILDALEDLMLSRTTLVIAHRFSTVRRADQIIVLAEGRMIETGTHDELLAKAGHYARLHHLQTSPRTSETKATAQEPA
jgi:ATP-binding cassette subfamily B protein/subfamily B ATP-binding cassette protein MsbA